MTGLAWGKRRMYFRRNMRTLTLVKPLILISCLMLTTSFTEANALARPFRYLTRSAGEVDYWPRWSPDGRRFAFSAEFFSPTKQCAAGCRGIAIAPVPERILEMGTAD